jgi:hypothetical protein
LKTREEAELPLETAGVLTLLGTGFVLMIVIPILHGRNKHLKKQQFQKSLWL